MVIYTQKDALIQALQSWKSQSQHSREIGFVPTMGALHQGHLSLIQKSIEENPLTVVSIFVNPTQFNDPADLEKYPRNHEKDLAVLNQLEGKPFVFLPEVSDIYTNGAVSEDFNFGPIETVMEGKFRNGHFNGVGTVLTKLFDIVTPTRAYFGEKDFQQLAIVKKLTSLKNLPVQIVGCPIVREKNGLAMSSRNSILSQKDREEAAFIYQILKEIQEKFHTHTLGQLKEIVAEQFLQNPNLELEYFEIADEDTLQTATEKNKTIRYRAFIAARIKGVRLIDNIPLN